METKTRAKFKCVAIAKREGYNGDAFHHAASFQVCYAGNPENKAFFASTPSGSIEISTVRADHFEVGKEYYVDFTPATVPAPASS